MPEPRYFKTPAAFRRWLETHHVSATELWVGYYKKATGKPSQTWSESVDQALCFGWIDGVRHRVDDERYAIRFTPRTHGSIWSAVNIRKVATLEKQGLMTAAGRKAFDRESVERSRIYAYEREQMTLARGYEAQIRRNRKAWMFWSTLAPYNKKTTTFWVMSAKKEATRQRRLDTLIECCAHGELVPGLRPRRVRGRGAAASS